jgi:hypothetical protein
MPPRATATTRGQQQQQQRQQNPNNKRRRALSDASNVSLSAATTASKKTTTSRKSLLQPTLLDEETTTTTTTEKKTDNTQSSKKKKKKSNNNNNKDEVLDELLKELDVECAFYTIVSFAFANFARARCRERESFPCTFFSFFFFLSVALLSPFSNLSTFLRCRVPRNRKNPLTHYFSLLNAANDNSPTEDRRSARANARGGEGDSKGV